MDERWQLPTKVLPSGGTQAWYVADGVLTSRRVDGAQVLPGAFLLPGLVDAHTHLAVRNYVPVGLPEALDALVGARNAGVLLLRDLGAPKGVRLAFPDDIPLPRVLAAGPWLATDEFFPDDRHDPVPPERLTEAAKGIVREGLEWVKVVADWMEPRLTYRFDVLRAAVDAVHEGGARVAAHSTRVTHEVVRAGVDSVEHGDEMDDETLAVMADRGIAWTPTVSALERDRAWAQAVIDSFDAATDPPERLAYAERWKGVWDRAAERLGERLPAAASLGVTILAGPDNGGSVATEVLLLHKYGLGVDQALAAATTGARRFLGAPALQEGAPADVVTFDSDPSGDLTVLSRPVAVLVGGHRV